MSVIVKYTSTLMSKKFVVKEEFNCTVMEVKMIEVKSKFKKPFQIINY